MRLTTHNLLKCNIKNISNGYPLRIEASAVEEEESEYDREKVKRMIQKLNWGALKSGASDIGHEELSSIDALPTDLDNLDDDILRIIHKLIFDIHIIEGNLICPATGRKFPIHDGIPNMLLHEDEL